MSLFNTISMIFISFSHWTLSYVRKDYSITPHERAYLFYLRQTLIYQLVDRIHDLMMLLAHLLPYLSFILLILIPLLQNSPVAISIPPESLSLSFERSSHTVCGSPSHALCIASHSFPPLSQSSPQCPSSSEWSHSLSEPSCYESVPILGTEFSMNSPMSHLYHHKNRRSRTLQQQLQFCLFGFSLLVVEYLVILDYSKRYEIHTFSSFSISWSCCTYFALTVSSTFPISAYLLQPP